MQIFGIFGILAAYAVILLIDMPGLAAIENSRKYKKVYYSLAAVGVLIVVLKILGLIPYYDLTIINIYKKLFGSG